MLIKEANYLLSAAWKSQWPSEDVPEICLAGRSNVGKSSFINTLCQRKALAKVSSTPGKTRTLNFYDINHAFRLVDVPGYGYAQISDDLKASFGKMVDGYIRQRKTLKAMVLLVDARHKPTKDDVMMYQYMKHYDIPVIVVATKEDKLKRNDLKKNKNLIMTTLGMDPQDHFAYFSSLKKTGREEVWTLLETYLEG